MRHREIISAVEWAKRVNGAWLVRSDLNHHSAEWIAYLESRNDPRLVLSCEHARRVCDLRAQQDDPKPWFYAGLFHLATPEEVQRFLGTHSVTRATVPSMWADPAVLLWLDRVGPETVELMNRLRRAI